MIPESQRHRKLSSASLKKYQSRGKDKLDARELYKNMSSFIMKTKAWLVANRNTISADCWDQAITDRLAVLNWKTRFVNMGDIMKDPNIRVKLQDPKVIPPWCQSEAEMEEETHVSYIKTETLSIREDVRECTGKGNHDLCEQQRLAGVTFCLYAMQRAISAIVTLPTTEIQEDVVHIMDDPEFVEAVQHEYIDEIFTAHACGAYEALQYLKPFQGFLPSLKLL